MTPGCSTCGYCVEWLRSCYQSGWRAFRDDLNLVVPGRYYFAPDDTPFYAGLTTLASRVWRDRNWLVGTSVSEAQEYPQTWDDGHEPAVVPEVKSVGSADCIANGETVAGAIDGLDLIAGFPAQCFVPPVLGGRVWAAAAAYDSCAIQYAAARLITWLYDANETSIRDFLSAFLGPRWTLTFHPRQDPLPAIFTAKASDGFLMWVEGTATNQQLAQQACYALRLPADYGNFGTMPFWYHASNYALSVAESDGLTSGMPFFVAGHSYGAVVSLLLSARLRAADARRDIRWITFGCPKPGDSRLSDLLLTTEGMSLANDSDLITVFPPTLASIWPVYIVLGSPGLLFYPAWFPPPHRFIQASDGTLTPNEDVLVDTATLLTYATDWIASLPTPPVFVHPITIYAARIFERCGQAEWPIDAADYSKLEATGYIAMEGAGDVLDESSQPILLEWEGP